MFILPVLGCLVMMVVGWTKWFEEPRQAGISPDYSFIGMLLSSATVLGLFVFGFYAAIFGIRFSAHYDLLVGIYKFLAPLCAFGLLFGLVGVRRRNPLRWYASSCAFFTACLWLVGAVMIDPI
jgi:hypothetical protein